MAAVAQPTSQMIACDIVPGNAADDPLYLPLIRRVRQQLGQKSLLYCGDCKMAALATRAELVAEKDKYLMPLPRTGDNASSITKWIEEAVQGKQSLKDLKRRTAKGEEEVFAQGYECTRDQSDNVAGKSITWSEHVQVIRSLELVQRQAHQLEERLQEGSRLVRALTPPVGRGHHQYREEEALRAAVAKILEEKDVVGLLEVKWQREEQKEERYSGRGRGGPNRKTYTKVKVRYAITEVKRQEKAIDNDKAKQGWRVQVTNLPDRWSRVHSQNVLCSVFIKFLCRLDLWLWRTNRQLRFSWAGISGDCHSQSKRRLLAILSPICTNVSCHCRVKAAARNTNIPSAFPSSHNNPLPFKRRLITRRMALSMAPLPIGIPAFRKAA